MAVTTLNITPGTVAFGNVSVGLTADIIVNFSLSGVKKDVLVQYSSGLSAPFTQYANPMPFYLNAGNAYSYNETFRFAPTGAGAFSQTVTIAANTDDTPPITFAITGTGVTATKDLATSVGSLDFGKVQLGNHSDLSFNLINSSSPSASISGSVGSPGGDFTVISGGGAFTLTNNGDIHGVTIRYTPSVVGTAANSVPITHTATTPSSPFSFFFSGFGYVYALIDTVVPAGTVSIVMMLDGSLPLYSSVGFKSSPVSVQQSLLLNMDQHNEKVDVKLGTYEYDALQLEFMEDYTVYSEGLWYKIFHASGTLPIRFLVTMSEGGTQRFVIYGSVDVSTPPDFTEYALTASQNIRSVKFQLISGLDILKNVTSAALITEALTHKTTQNSIYTEPISFAQLGTGPWWVLLIDILASAVKLAFNQSFAQTDVQVRNEDMQFGWHDVWGTGLPDQLTNFASLYLIANDFYDAHYHLYSYLDSSHSMYWANSLGTAFDVFQAIVFPFGFVPRYYFGQDDGSYKGDGSDRHHIELLSRGRAGNLVSPLGVIRDSHYTPTSQYDVNNVRATFAGQPTESRYISNGAEFTGAALAAFQPDIDIQSQFDLGNGTSYGGIYNQMLYGVPTGIGGFTGMYQVNRMQYWDYIAKALVGPTYQASTVAFLMSYLCEYFYRKFHGQSSYQREYGDVRATDLTTSTVTQWNLRCLKRTQITDEYGTRNFYAIEVDKDYFKNVAKVTWFQE